MCDGSIKLSRDRTRMILPANTSRSPKTPLNPANFAVQALVVVFQETNFFSAGKLDKVVTRRSRARTRPRIVRRREITGPEYHRRRRVREGGKGVARGAHFHRNSTRMAMPSNATIPQRNLECPYTHIRADVCIHGFCIKANLQYSTDSATSATVLDRMALYVYA